MREIVRDQGRLEHIVTSINTLIDNKAKYTFDVVVNDPILFFGFVKHVEIIGEAVYMLSKDFKSAHPATEWDSIEKMRHVLVHGYYAIRPIQVWNVIEKDLQPLKVQIEQYLSEMEETK